MNDYIKQIINGAHPLVDKEGNNEPFMLQNYSFKACRST